MRNDRPVLLVADRNHEFTRLVRLVAERRGMLVLQAKTGLEALQLALDWRPDAVLAELDLPDLCGIALCQAVSETPGLGSIPCILRTAGPLDGATMRWAIEAGVSDFVPKTCPIDEVVERADQLLRPSASPRSFAFRCGAVDELRTARLHVSKAAAAA